MQDCVVADAVQREPVSTPKFPANRENNREFFNFGSVVRLRSFRSSNDLGAFEPDSLLTRTGNFLDRAENLHARTGNFISRHQPSLPAEIFDA